MANLSVCSQLKLFDATIKPILLYGYEIWGGYLYKLTNDDNLIIRMLTDFTSLIQKLHSKVSKQILHVNKNANTYAIRCELGRYPLIIEVFCKLIKYYVNICKRTITLLLKQHYVYKFLTQAHGLSLQNLFQNH